LAEEFFSKANVNIKRLPMPGKIIEYDIDSFRSAKKFENK
jgi:hypothetical protein